MSYLLVFAHREVKDSRYLQEKVTTKAAKEMFEHALKIESEYKQLINGKFKENQNPAFL